MLKMCSVQVAPIEETQVDASNLWKRVDSAMEGKRWKVIGSYREASEQEPKIGSGILVVRSWISSSNFPTILTKSC